MVSHSFFVDHPEEFFAFYRSLEAYKNALTDGNASMVLSPDSEFFQFFRKSMR